jgi:hypothetical protein
MLCPQQKSNTNNSWWRLQIMKLRIKFVLDDWGLIPSRGREGWSEANDSSRSSTDVKMRGAIPLLRQYVLIAWCLIKQWIRLYGMAQVKHKDNFTFIFSWLCTFFHAPVTSSFRLDYIADPNASFRCCLMSDLSDPATERDLYPT